MGLCDVAYQRIKEKIMSGDYKPGVYINEEFLMQDLGMGRTPVREAVIMLEQQQIVQVLPQKGIRIIGITFELVRKICEVRMIIEPYILRTYGARFPRESLLEYLQYFTTCETRPLLEINEKDEAFHRDIAACCENELLMLACDSARAQSYRVVVTLVGGNPTKIQREQYLKSEHIDIILTMLQENFNAAAELLLQHLTNGRGNMYNMLMRNSEHRQTGAAEPSAPEKRV